jgi:hypothetical protein
MMKIRANKCLRNRGTICLYRLSRIIIWSRSRNLSPSRPMRATKRTAGTHCSGHHVTETKTSYGYLSKITLIQVTLTSSRTSKLRRKLLLTMNLAETRSLSLRTHRRSASTRQCTGHRIKVITKLCGFCSRRAFPHLKLICMVTHPSIKQRLTTKDSRCSSVSYLRAAISA